MVYAIGKYIYIIHTVRICLLMKALTGPHWIKLHQALQSWRYRAFLAHGFALESEFALT